MLLKCIQTACLARGEDNILKKELKEIISGIREPTLDHNLQQNPITCVV